MYKVEVLRYFAETDLISAKFFKLVKSLYVIIKYNHGNKDWPTGLYYTTKNGLLQNNFQLHALISQNGDIIDFLFPKLNNLSLTL